MNYETKPYELSLWDDMPKSQLEDGQPSHSATEIRRCVIASHTMSSPAKAYNITLNRKVNGENTLTFSINAQYFDEEIGDYVTNPYLKFLSNERKVKLWRMEKNEKVWYDFIIKNVSEDSSNSTFTYTAKDQHIQELAKSGFNLIFDRELNNNTKTAEELADEILSDTNWEVEKSESLLEYTDEPLYKAAVKEQIVLTNMLVPSESITLESGSFVYVPYSVIQNKEKFCQVLYSTSSFADENLPKDEDGVLQLEYFKNYYFYTEYDDSNFPEKLTKNKLLLDCRGARLVRIPKTIYNDKLEKYLDVYTKDGEIYYGFTETEYQTPNFVQSLITNGFEFSSITGWNATKIGNIETERELYVDPPVLEWSGEDAWNSNGQIENLKTFIKITPSAGAATIFNHGFFDNRTQTKGLTEGQEFFVRVKANSASSASGRLGLEIGEPLSCSIKICDYDIDGKFFVPKIGGQTYFEDTIKLLQNEETCFGVVSVRSGIKISEEELSKLKIGIFLSFGTFTSEDVFVPRGGTVLIEKAEFFPKILDENGEIIYPDTTVSGTEEAVKKLIKTHYYYFGPYAENEPIEHEKQEDIAFSDEGYEPNPNYMLQYHDDYQKRRTITAKESNRFNLLQEICEVFECWLKFKFERDEKGGIISRKIRFQEYVGKQNYSGFKYGINLNSIKRTLDSNKIVTKLIVKNNSNQFAKNGFCTIARAPSNPSGTNVIYNFDYYISQNLLEKSAVDQDLYNTDTGLYPQLMELSRQYNELSEKLIAVSENIVSLKATVGFEEARLEAAKTEGVELRESLQKLTGGFTFENFAGITKVDTELKENFEKWKKDVNIVPYMTKIFVLERDRSDAELQLSEAQKQLEEFEETKVSLEEEQNNINENQKKIEKDFYQRYARFIQEGSWISEDYVDDNLYYLDSLATLYTSAKPQVSYTINVFDLNHVEGYENYNFDIGDKSFVEDPEFFGWETNGEYKRPKREEVIVSEVTSGIDNPEKNNFKIQNYKTQFDDLFQRIAAATESLQYNTGRYERFSNAVETDGSLSYAALQETVNQNGLTIANAGAQTVSCDERGIITVDKSMPAKQVRIIGGGIFMTTDGGESWKTGLTGDGINASVITTGQLNAGEVNIMTDSAPSHKWDNRGISAYKAEYNINDGTITSIDNGSFVRMDEFGIYGIKNIPDFDARVFDENGHGIEKIEANATFSLTSAGVTIGGINGLKATKDELTIGGEKGLVATSTGLTIGDYFSVQDGVLSISGWQIGEGYFGNEEDTMWLSANGKTVGEKKYVIYANDKFKVSSEGEMYATSGEIGGWQIEGSELYAEVGSNKTLFKLSPAGVSTSINGMGGNYIIIAGSKFGVLQDGTLSASNAQIEGTITAGSGKIGGWYLTETVLQNVPLNSSTNPSVWLTANGKNGTVNSIKDNYVFYANGNFGVTRGGVMRAENVDINGVVKLKDGSQIGNFKTDSNSIYTGEWITTTPTKAPDAFMSTGSLNSEYNIAGKSSNRWVFGAGNKFGVTKEGNVFTSGTMTIGSGTISNTWTFGPIPKNIVMHPGLGNYSGTALYTSDQDASGIVNVYLTPVGCYCERMYNDGTDPAYLQKTWPQLLGLG